MVLHYKCPGCGSDMSFDAKLGVLACDYCGHKDEIETIEEEIDSTSISLDDSKEYQCNNCGAQVITGSDTSATTCCFCESAVVLSDRITGEFSPDLVIPFTIEKNKAKKLFKKWIRNKLFAPSEYKKANKINEIKGLYVPYWIYDLKGRATVTARGKKVRYYSKGNYDYTETKHYDIYRKVNIDFLKVPVDASDKMDDELMDLTEPYDYSELKPFKSPYLAGYIAEKYNEDDEALLPRVKSKVQPFIKSYISSTISGYSSVSYKNEDSSITQSQSAYSLFPVWIFNYDFENREHTYIMNGQTGKIIGKPPQSKAKMVTFLLTSLIIIFVIARFITVMLGGPII